MLAEAELHDCVAAGVSVVRNARLASARAWFTATNSVLVLNVSAQRS